MTATAAGGVTASTLGGTFARTAGFAALWWFVLAALCLILLAPLTIADVPPLMDYPNHLARLFILAHPEDPVLARFWVPHWSIIPNLALDLTVPPLLRIFPVHLVGRAVLGILIILPVLGSAAYHRALTGRLSYWPLGSALFVYNACLLRGFLNFIVALGLGLLVAAAWVAWRERRPALAIAITAAGAAALYLCHLTGVLFLAILIGGHELAQLLAVRFNVGTLIRRSAAVALVFAIPTALYATSGLGHLDCDPLFGSVAFKANNALTPVINYDWPLDLLTAALCVAVPGVCLVMRWCRMPLEAAAATLVLLGLFIALPFGFKQTYYLDTRFIVMAAFTIPAALVSARLPRRAASVIGGVLLMLFIARMGVLISVWDTWADDLADFREVVASVQPGDAVMTHEVQPGTARLNGWTTVQTAHFLSNGDEMDQHLPALLVIEHRAWWPKLFDDPSQQPICSPAPVQIASDMIDNSRDPLALLAHDPPELRMVTHVLIQGPDPALVDQTGLRLLAESRWNALFAVDRSPRKPAR